MGLSVGSGTAGGGKDVLFQNNVMTTKVRQLGQGIHIKTRDMYGGYVCNIAWIGNIFHVTGSPGGAIKIEAWYQSGISQVLQAAKRIAALKWETLSFRT